jgi:hypothetical protein
MAGKIIADTLEHSTAGSIATNYVVEGSAKQWAYFIATMTSIADSLNVSSIADEGTGDSGINLTSAMSSANYANSNVVETASFQNTSGNVRLAGLHSKTASKINYRGDYIVNDLYAGGYEGSMYHNVSSLGDLA